MTIYSYDWQGTIKFQGVAQSISQSTPPDQAKTQIQTAFEQASKELALQKFSEQFAKLGRTLAVNTITVKTDKLQVNMYPLIPYPSPFIGWAFKGQTTIYVQFDTDVASTEHFSPQGWEEILLAIAEALLAALTAHTLIAALVVLALVIGIVGIAWKLTGTSAWSLLTGGAGDIVGTIFALAVLGIGGLLLYTWLSGKKKR